MAERAVYVRVGVRDTDRAIAALRSVGIEGERAIGRITAATPPASRGLLAVNAASGQLRGGLEGMAGHLGPAGAALSALGAGGLVAAAGVGAAAVAAKEIVQAGDRFSQYLGRLAAATGSAQGAAAAFQTLYTQTRAVGGDLDASVAAFVRFQIAAKDLGKGTAEVARLVDVVGKFGAVSGASSQEASAGALQLGQALASGVLQGDELRSILENMPSLAQALAEALGVPIGQLRAMGAAGELTAEKVFNALLKAGAKADEQFSKLPVTVERASAMASTAWTKFAAEIDKSLGLSEKLARVLSGVADQLDGLSARVANAPAGAVARLERDREAMIAQLHELEAIEAQFPGTYTDGRGKDTGELASTRAVLRGMEERLNAARALAVQEDVLAEAEKDRAAAGLKRAAADKKRVDGAAAELALVKDLLPLEKAAIERNEKLATIAKLVGDEKLSQARATELSVAAHKEYEEAVEKVTHAEAERSKAAKDAAKEADKEAAARDRAMERVTDQIAGLRNERDALGLTERERFIFSEALKAEKTARDELGAGADAYVAQVRAEAGALYDRRKAQEAADDAAKRADKARKDYQQEQQRVVEGSTDRLVDWAGDALFDRMEGKAESFWKTVEKLGKRAFAEIAANAVIRTFIQPVVGSVVGALPGLFGLSSPAGAGAAVGQAGGLGSDLGSAYQAASLLKNGYSMFSGGAGLAATQAAGSFATSGVGSALGLSQSAVGVIPEAVAGDMMLTSSGNALMSGAGTLGAAMPYGAVGGVLGGLAGTAMNSKVGGAAVGAAAGAASAGLGASIWGMGAVGGPWGIAAAAVISAVMAMIGTQKKSVGPNMAGNVFLDGDGGFKSGPSAADNGADAGQMAQVTDSLAAALNAVIQGAGAKVTGAADMNTGHIEYYQEGNKWSVTPMHGGADGARREFTSQDEALQFYLRDSLQRLNEKGVVTGLSDDVKTALTNSKATKADDLVNDLQYAAGQRESIEAMTRAIGLEDAARKAGKTSAEDLAKAITAFRDKAADLSLHVAEANAATKRWVDDMVAGIKPKTYTQGEADAATVTAKWQNMDAVLRAVGYSAEEAAAKMRDGLANELANLAKDKSDGVRRQRLEAAGRGYLNEIEGLSEALTINARDFAALGRPIAEAHGLFDTQLHALLSGLDATQLADVTRTLGGDIGALAERMRAASAAATAEGVHRTALEATGRGYLNSIAELQSGLEANAASLTAAGRPIAEAHTIFDNQLRALLSGLDAGQLADVTRTLGGDIGHLADSMRQASVAAAAAARGQDMRARAMTAAGNGAGAALYQFDNEAEARRVTARDAGAGAAELVQLDQVIAAERGRLVMEQARTDVLEAIDRQVRAVTDNSAAARELTAANAAFVATVRTKISDRLLGGASDLNDEQKLAEATRQITELMPQALSGDAAARARVLDLIDRRDELSKTVYASSSSASFRDGQALLDQLGDTAEGQLGEAERAVRIADDTLRELQRQRDQTARLGERNLAGLDVLNATFLASFHQLESTLAGVSGLNGYNPQLSAIIGNATADQLASLQPMARQAGPVLWTEFLRRADALGHAEYAYSSPGDVQSKSEQMSPAQLAEIARAMGFSGGYTREFNYWLVTNGKQQEFIDLVRNTPVRQYGFGGSIAPGGLGIVGETGRPELVAGPATVFDPDQTSRLVALAGGRGGPVAAVDLRRTEATLGRIAGIMEHQLGLAARAGDGTLSRLDRIASVLEDQAGQSALRAMRRA